MKKRLTITTVFFVAAAVVTAVLFVQAQQGTQEPTKTTAEPVATTQVLGSETFQVEPTVTPSNVPSLVADPIQNTTGSSLYYGSQFGTVRLTPPVTTRTSDSAVSNTYTIDTLGTSSLRNYRIDLTRSFNAIAFTWESGEFAYSFDGVNFTQVDDLHEHRPDWENDGLASELVFVSESHPRLYVRSQTVAGLEVHTIDSTRASNVATANFTSSAASGGEDYVGALFTKQPIVSRDAWGADEEVSLWNPSYGPVTRLTVHHSAGSNTSDDWASVVRAVFYYHTVTLDWGDVGYHYMIDPNGVIYEGRKGGDGTTAAHAYGYNYGNMGVSMLGTYTNTLPTLEARDSLRALLSEKAEIHNFENLNWGNNTFGHRDFNSTSCPGTALYNQLPTLVGYADEERVALMQDVASATDATDLAFDDWNTRTAGVFGDLMVTFDYPETVNPDTIKNLIPEFSGIELSSVDGNRAYIRIHRYYTEEDEPNLFRVKFLHSYFLLRNDVSKVEIVGDYNILPITIEQSL